eukprot:CAMPEP_0114235010 /NCGR_PEP_ID=MMETSP0058-20121206/6012_1 /TAXON_ID=36894 /ORGANISM="Pyramimonas parkeae, CCMP726" /LENGTH=1053 /DNA_ID=CAMNT_0001346723 /DNA_START=275 /DNA_END=3436 /DNA_ORIENTATION=-
MSGWSRPKLADNSKAFYNRLRELSDKHDERGQELLRGEDGAGMHSTRSKRACASVKNPFPATNPYHNPVPKPTPRTNRAVKSAQESLKKAAGSCSGGAPDAGVGRGVPGSEECWAEAKMRVKEQLSMLGGSEGSLDKLKVRSSGGRPLTKWEKLSLGQSATSAEVSAVEALMHNPMMAVRMLVEQNVADAMSASPRTARKAPAVARVDCGQRPRGAPGDVQREAGNNGSRGRGPAPGSRQGERSLGDSGAPTRDAPTEEVDRAIQEELQRRRHRGAAGGRPHSAQPGLPRHSKPQQESACSSARVATVTFADHPADPFPRMQSRPRPSSAQPIAAKERASRAVAGAGNQPQRHLEAGGRDDSTVPCSSPGGGADPTARLGDHEVVHRNNRDAPNQEKASSKGAGRDDVFEPMEERALVGDVADAAATGGAPRPRPARPLSAQPRVRKESAPERPRSAHQLPGARAVVHRPRSAHPVVRSSTMGHVLVSTSGPAPPPPAATVSRESGSGSDGPARPASAVSFVSEKDFNAIEEEEEDQFFQDIDERDEDDLVYRQMDAAQAQVRPGPSPCSAPAGWTGESHSTAYGDPKPKVQAGLQQAKRAQQACARAEDSSADGLEGPLVTFLPDGAPAVSSYRDRGATPADSVRSWAPTRPWSHTSTEDGDNGSANGAAREKGGESKEGGVGQHKHAVVPRMARPQSASASGMRRPAIQEKHPSRAEMELNLQLSRVSTAEEMALMQSAHLQPHVLPNKQQQQQQPAHPKRSSANRPRSSYTLKERMEAISRSVMEEEEDQARRVSLRPVSAKAPKVVLPPEPARVSRAHVAAATTPGVWKQAPAPNRVPTPLQAEVLEDEYLAMQAHAMLEIDHTQSHQDPNLHPQYPADELWARPRAQNVEDGNAVAVRPPSSAWDGESQSDDLPAEMCQASLRTASSASDVDAGDEYTKCHVLVGHIASELEEIGRSNGKSNKGSSSDDTKSEPALRHRLHRIVRRLRLHVTQNSAALQGTCDALATFPMEKQDLMLRGCAIMGHAQLVDMIKMRLSHVYPISTPSSS